jgi:DMSO/TMAO reductase YedYZ molybdopterin-dependent catalytic subunit
MGAGAVGMAAVWRWLNVATPDGDISRPLRSVLGLNERVARTALFSDSHHVKTYPASAIRHLKVNGEIGMEQPLEDPAAWQLELSPAGGGNATRLGIADIKSLPRVEQIIDFKCVEGWSVVTQFAGARLADFTAKFAPGSEKAAWVGMNTPSKDYYVGIDMPSALHPQTLLAYEMNGKPLEDRHGAPLRLVIPVKYGIKNIKRIARIEYTDKRPADYWFEQGYDYYSGL